jgi:hypothetical protein
MARRSSRPLLLVSFVSLALAGFGLVAEPGFPGIAAGPVTVVARDIPIDLERQQVVALPFASSDVALHWHGSPDAVVSIELAVEPGAFGESIVLDRDEAGEGRNDGETYGDVIWTAGARFVRVTSDRPIGHVTVVAFQADGPPRAVLASGPVVSAALNQPAVITRAGWGADESLRFDAAGHEKWPPSYFRIAKFFVHHTAGRNGDPDPAATIRSIYHYHTITQGWGDIGYNFLIDEQGRIYEGRHARAYASGETPTSEDLAGLGARGAQAKDYNEGSIGVALLGTFDTQLPTTAARASLEKLIAWDAERHGISPTGSSTYVNPVSGIQKTFPNVAGHRDVNSTDCPGAKLYAALPSIRSSIASRIAAATGAAVDHTAPSVKSLTAMAPTPTGGKSISFGLIFSEPVTGLSTSDLHVSGTSPGWTVTSLTGAAATYTVTVSAGAPVNGSVVLGLPAGSVTDLGANAGPTGPASATAQYALDVTRPAVSVYATPSGPATNATSFVVTVTFNEPVGVITAADVAIGGTSDASTNWPVDPVVGSGAHFGFSMSNANPANGTLTMAIPAGVTSDAAGNPNVASNVHTVIIDRTAPYATPPGVKLRSGVSWASGLPVTVSWSAGDSGGSGIRSYDLARSVDGGTFSIIASGIASPSAALSLTSGHTYRFEARARDRAGNLGAWKVGPTVYPTLLQQSSSSVAYQGTWGLASATSYSGGSARYATGAGASASVTRSAGSLAFFTTRGPNRGAVKIYVDGTYRTTVDLYAASLSYRYVAYAVAWSAVETHTLKVVVVGTAGRPRVDFDAVEVVR